MDGEVSPVIMGTALQLSCRAGEEYCTLSQLFDSEGNTLAELPAGQEAMLQGAVLPQLNITSGMPFTLKEEGVVVAEGAILDILKKDG